MKIYILCLLALSIAQDDLWQPDSQNFDSDQISYDFDGNVIENQVNIETTDNQVMDEYQTNSDVQIADDVMGVQPVQEVQDDLVEDNNFNGNIIDGQVNIETNDNQIYQTSSDVQIVDDVMEIEPVQEVQDVLTDSSLNMNDQSLEQSANLQEQGISFEMQEQQEYKLTLEEHPISQQDQGEVLQEIDTQVNLQDIDPQIQDIQESDTQESDTQEELQSSSPVEIVQDSDIEVIDETVSYQAATLELPIEQVNIVDNEGNMVDSVEGLSTYLSIDQAEVNDAPADRVLEFRSDDCIVIFAQCNFKGDQMEVCDSLSSVQNFEHQIQSIFIPEGQSLTVYEQENYSGDKVKYTTSQSCLFKPVSFAQIMRSSKLILLTINNNLRGK